MTREKALEIFKELVGERAARLSGSHFPADVNSRITAALLGHSDPPFEEVQRKDRIGFHVVDWQAEAAFIVALVLFPERFTDEEICDGVENLLIHAPAHILEAARLAGFSTKNIFEEESGQGDESAPLRYHDFHLHGYSVSDSGATITLHLVYDYPDKPTIESCIEFSGVAAYQFVHTGGAIITDIDELPLATLLDRIGDTLTANWHQHGGYDHWNDYLSKYRSTLEKEGCRGWSLESAIGFGGYVIAKGVRQKSLTGEEPH